MGKAELILLVGTIIAFSTYGNAAVVTGLGENIFAKKAPSYEDIRRAQMVKQSNDYWAAVEGQNRKPREFVQSAITYPVVG
jgi:hypothetical protein